MITIARVPGGVTCGLSVPLHMAPPGQVCHYAHSISYLLPQQCCITNSPKTQWLQIRSMHLVHESAVQLKASFNLGCVFSHGWDNEGHMILVHVFLILQWASLGMFSWQWQKRKADQPNCASTFQASV